MENFPNPIINLMRRFIGQWGCKNLENDNKFQKIEKIFARFVNKLLQICNIKKLKIILLPIKNFFISLLSIPGGRFLAPGTGKKLNIENRSHKI